MMIGIDDIYNGGRYLHRWTLVAGSPRCVETALYLPDADEGEIAQALAVNRAIRAAGAAVESYERAQRLLAGDAPESWVPGTNDQGDAIMTVNPAWTAYLAAQVIVAGAGSDLIHMARTRADVLDEGEAPYDLTLPPLPALDPRTETADWAGGAWVVRDLTGDELAVHPLRPAPMMSKMAFAGLLVTTLGDGLGMAVLGMYGSVLALASDVDWIDVFDHLNGDPERPGYAVQLLAAEAVTAGQIEALRDGWVRACRA